MYPSRKLARAALAWMFALTCASCGGDGGGASGGSASNLARFTLDCDLQGVVGVLTMDVEIVASSGVVWGPGSDPDITAVIGTGDVTFLTAGELRSPVALYTFRGENQYADFTDAATLLRFRVEWRETRAGLSMIVNPFGPGPTRHDCVLTDARFL